MNLLTIILISATVLRNVAYLDVARGAFVQADVIIDRPAIEKITRPGKARAAGKDLVIDAAGLYLVPALIDLWVLPRASPGGNVWVNEFLAETRRKNELALIGCGVRAVGALPPVRTTPRSTGLDVHALGPWVTIPSSQPVTPYGLEEWNPHVFEISRLEQPADVAPLVARARQNRARGIILSLPRAAYIPATDIALIETLKQALRAHGLLLFGLTYGPVDERLLDLVAPDVLVGWLPDRPHERVTYEMPLFLEPQRIPDPTPHAVRLSLGVAYAFTRVGLDNEARRALATLDAHNVEVLKQRPAGRLLLGSGAGLPGIFFGPATIRALESFVDAGFTEAEALLIATANAYGFLNMEGAIAEGAAANLTLIRPDRSGILAALARPVALFSQGRLIVPDVLRYEIDSLGFSPLVMGTPLELTDFSDDKTALGSEWRAAILSFGLDGQWQANTLSGRKARGHGELWSKGGIINFVAGDTAAWDLSLYEGFKLEVEQCNTPCSIYVLSKAVHWTQGPAVYLKPGAAEVTSPCAPAVAGHVQGLYLKPVALGQGDYSISLRRLSLLEPGSMASRVAANLFTRIEHAVDLGDTALLWQARTQVDLGLRFYPTPEMRYLRVYVNYRLATMLPENDRIKGQLIEEALKLTRDEAALEMKILEYALMGLAAGIDPLKAILHGRRLNELADRLEREAADNPRARLVLGMAKLYTPAMFGGSLDRAVEHLAQSVARFRAAGPSDAYAWGRADAMVFLAEAHRKAGRQAQARQVLDELRALAPFYAYGALKRLAQ